MKWQPSADIQTLRLRAQVIAQIRTFFKQRAVMEVETPLLASTTVTDPHIHSMTADYGLLAHVQHAQFYLQTSPEFYMKRLLAAGSGAIFQIGKAFRDDELGRQHHPEFTMLEWYRPGFDHYQLMDEVAQLLINVLAVKHAVRQTYQEVFQKYLDFDPHTANCTQLQACAEKHALAVSNIKLDDRDEWLDLLLSHIVIPQIDSSQPLFIYDFPVTQAALARIVDGLPPVAARFEVYLAGMELANGFYELTDANEQRQRFMHDNIVRQKKGLPQIKIDENFLRSLNAMPDCAGVALGIDRLLMALTQCDRINDVLSFHMGV